MFDVEIAHYAWVVILLLGACIAWTTNFLTLPGNWMIVGLAALFAWSLPASTEQIGWQTVGMLAGLALLGEVLEFTAGAAGAANKGASRRAVVLALVGTFVGSIAGVIIGPADSVDRASFGSLGGCCWRRVFRCISRRNVEGQKRRAQRFGGQGRIGRPLARNRR